MGVGEAWKLVAKKWVSARFDTIKALLFPPADVPVRLVLSHQRSGTTALGATLSSLGGPVLSTHYIGKASRRYFYMSMHYDDGPLSVPLNRPHIITLLTMKLSRRPIQVFSSVRDPVARELSTFVSKVFARYPDVILKWPLARIYDYFYRSHALGPDRTITWFDEAFYPEIGVDIYASPFDKQLGYGKIQGGRFPSMIVKSEAVRDPIKRKEIARALGAFMGTELDDMVVSCDNDAQYRGYYLRYREIVDNFVADDIYLDRLYNSKYMRHFYTDEEIEAFRAKWTH